MAEDIANAFHQTRLGKHSIYQLKLYQFQPYGLSLRSHGAAWLLAFGRPDRSRGRAQVDNFIVHLL